MMTENAKQAISENKYKIACKKSELCAVVDIIEDLTAKSKASEMMETALEPILEAAQDRRRELLSELRSMLPEHVYANANDAADILAFAKWAICTRATKVYVTGDLIMSHGGDPEAEYDLRIGGRDARSVAQEIERFVRYSRARQEAEQAA